MPIHVLYSNRILENSTIRISLTDNRFKKFPTPVLKKYEWSASIKKLFLVSPVVHSPNLAHSKRSSFQTGLTRFSDSSAARADHQESVGHAALPGVLGEREALQNQFPPRLRQRLSGLLVTRNPMPPTTNHSFLTFSSPHPSFCVADQLRFRQPIPAALLPARSPVQSH